MSWLKKGPELKLPKLRKPRLKRAGTSGRGAKGPSIKPPALLADLYDDMRDRRLLPLVALVLVAIIAVPFLIGSDPEPLPPVSEGTSPEMTTARASRLTVVEATPGLRDYRKRLRSRTATDPFEQQYTESPGGSASSSSAEGASSSSSSAEESVTTESSSATVEIEAGGGSSDGSGGSGGNGQGQGPQLIEFVFDVQISHSEETADGGTRMSELEVRHKVPTLTQLPGKKAPVVTVAGINLHNGEVFLLVSDEVKSLDGDFACVTRAPGGLCELLEVEAGFPLELVYGPDRVLYRIKVTKIDAVSAGEVGDGARSSRAAFGPFPAAALPRP